MKVLKVVHAGVVPYGVASEWQRDLHARRVKDEIPDVLLLLEHPHVYTLGRRFNREHLLVDEAVLASRGVEVHEADRGGSITYHGPGQLVGYPIVDLKDASGRNDERTHPDAIRYLRVLEEALIRSVRTFGVVATRREGMTGVWVGQGKLAAIGVHISRGVTRHGFALNVNTDLSFFEAMVPCGITDGGVTSLEEILGLAPSVAQVADSVVASLSKLLHRLIIASNPSDLRLSPISGTEDEGATIIPLRRQKVVGDPAAPTEEAVE